MAKVAGVSVATVSRVVNGKHWVAPQTRELVEKAIRDTGYTTNHSARTLATGRSDSLAFLLTEEHHLLFSDPTFSMLLRGAAEALTKRRMTLVLLVAGTPDERAAVHNYVSSGHVDGVMLVSSHESDPLLESLVEAGVPTVSCGLPLGHQVEVPSVSVDEAGSASEMTRYLMGQGHRRIAMIAGPQDTPGGRFRLDGFKAALGEAFDPRLVVQGDYSVASGEAAMEQLLAQGQAPDAVFAASDSMAVGAIRALRRAGMAVPEDVAVGGFDDSGLAESHDPPLTTMAQPWSEIAEGMVELLLSIIDGAAPEQRTLPTRLVVRSSA
ncbi:MAG: LacI family DNA-binding transcriptional regulator [Propionibacteriaceae bacterium]|nr:LacI family DNA-binding transcriptional regulator [Propionibacteriaceae bacterium]